MEALLPISEINEKHFPRVCFLKVCSPKLYTDFRLCINPYIQTSPHYPIDHGQWENDINSLIGRLLVKKTIKFVRLQHNSYFMNPASIKTSFIYYWFRF